MQMRDGLAGVGTVVDDEPVTAALQAEPFGHSGGLKEQVAEDLMILRAGFGQTRDGFLGNDQHMRRCLRSNIAEGDDLVVFEDNVGRNFAGDDFFKQSFIHRPIKN